MKETLLKALDVVIVSLEKNEVQTIEVRGAIVAGIQFKSALSVVEDKDLVEVVKELTKEPVAPVVTVTPVEQIEPAKEVVKEIVNQKV